MVSKVMIEDSKRVIEGLGDLNQQFCGKTVLLTGAAGFLGLNFVCYFDSLNKTGILHSPVRIIAVDNFLRGRESSLAFLESEHVILKNHDVTKPFDFLGDLDFIIHAASVASPTFYRKYPLETIDANVLGLRHLLDYSVCQPVQSFLFFSSSEVYGDPPAAEIPTSEHYNGNVSFTGPRACYDESKRFGETLCTAYWNVHRVPVKVARPFNNYGPGLSIHDGRVLPDFFRDVISNKDIVLLSDGRATRTFCYVSDALEGYLRLLASGHNGQAFNIGTEEPEISMAELAEEVIKASGKSLKVMYRRSEDEHYLTDNPQRRCPCIAKARILLGYNPRVDLQEGLQRSYRYYCEVPLSA